MAVDESDKARKYDIDASFEAGKAVERERIVSILKAISKDHNHFFTGLLATLIEQDMLESLLLR